MLATPARSPRYSVHLRQSAIAAARIWATEILSIWQPAVPRATHVSHLTPTAVASKSPEPSSASENFAVGADRRHEPRRDPELAEQIKISRAWSIVLLIEHKPDVVTRLADSGGPDWGKIAEGTPDEVRERAVLRPIRSRTLAKA
jgi:hypothetical protein